MSRKAVLVIVFVALSILAVLSIAFVVEWNDKQSKIGEEAAAAIFASRNGRVSITYMEDKCEEMQSVDITDSDHSIILLNALAEEFLQSSEDRWSHNSAEYAVLVQDDNMRMEIALSDTSGINKIESLGTGWRARSEGRSVSHALCSVFYVYYGLAIMDDNCFTDACYNLIDCMRQMKYNPENELSPREVDVLRNMIPDIEKRYVSIKGHDEDLNFYTP